MPAHVTVLLSANPAAWDQARLESALAQLPQAAVGNALRYARWQDRQNRILSRLLLAAGLRHLGLDPALLANWRTTPSGRPYLAFSPCDFSLSHTDGWTACGLSLDTRVGLDIERVRDLDPAELAIAFSPAELAAIQASPDPSRTMLRLWTAKEAVLKADGRGMDCDLRTVEPGEGAVELGGMRWFVKEVETEAEVACSLATSEERPTAEVRILTVKNLEV